MFEQMMLYPAPRVTVPSPPPGDLVERPLQLADGTEISAWWSAHPAPRATILFLHGNGENLELLRRGGVFEEFHQLGVSVLAIDYPSYGRSGGKPSQDSLVEATVVAFDQLAILQPEVPRLLVGWSLGAAVAVQAASHRPADALVMISAWDTLPELARGHFPAWMLKLVLRHSYDSLTAAAASDCPVLQLHGSHDRLIPIEHGRRLETAFGDRVRFVEVAAGHNEILGLRQVWDELGSFLGQLVERQKPESQ